MDQSIKPPYRLGLDVGSNSLGWFVVWLDGQGQAAGLGPGGVRIYTNGRDPKSKTSNAVDRRVARSARRRRDRYLKRRASLMDLLVAHGLMPTDETARKALERLNPYEFRARALDDALSPHEVGRALFHFKSAPRLPLQSQNRKERQRDGRDQGGRWQAPRAPAHFRRENAWRILLRPPAQSPVCPRSKSEHRHEGGI